MIRSFGSLVLILGIFSALSGCKLAVIVAEGGEVQSTTSGVCAAGSVCIHEVSDSSYSESFTAVPDAGWEFVKWGTGGNFFCQESTNPVCELSLDGTEGIIAIENVVASSKTFYIMPIFGCLVGCVGLPITDTVTVGGREWAQPDLFSGLTGEQVVARCPGGVCGENTVLNGWSMDGWQWATVDDVNALFNTFLIGYSLGPGPDSVQVPWDTYLLEPIFDAGFRPTLFDEGVHRFLVGLTSDGFVDEFVGSRLYVGSAVDNLASFKGSDAVRTNGDEGIDSGVGYIGVWLYRPLAP